MGSDPGEFREKLLDIEDKSGIFELEVNGIRLWQYIRWFCLVEIMYDVTGIVGRYEKRKRVSDQDVKMGFKERLARQQFLLSKKDLIVLNHPRRIKEGKYYRCFVTETLLENLECSYYVFEDALCGQHFRPAPTKNLKYINTGFLRKIFVKKSENTNRQLRIFYNKLMDVFEKDNKIKLSLKVKKEILNYVISGYYEIQCRTVWAKIVFSLVRPKALIIVAPYSPDAGAVIVEAKRRKIATIEMQHGINNDHFFYNYVYQGKVDIFPDYIFAYGECDREAKRYPIAKEKILPVGYPDLEKKAEKYKKTKKNGQNVMLFISNSEDIIAEYAVALRKDQRLNHIRMIYKLHPDEYGRYKSKYAQLADCGVEVISENKHDIYYYLGQADYVVGTESTALYEATVFGPEIYIISGGSYSLSRMLYEKGYAQLVTSADMLADRILNPVPFAKNKESYFAKNAVENMKQELDKIMKESDARRVRHGDKKKGSGHNSGCDR